MKGICTPKTFLLITISLITVSANTQDIIKGKVIDKSNESPIEDVFVYWGDEKETALTNNAGEFSIRIANFPVMLRFSHVSYGITEIELSTRPTEPLYVRLDRKVSRINEVQVSGERLRILTKDDDYSMLDYAFDKDALWMLGFVNNQANRQRLFLANIYGDTLKSIHIERAEKLYQDPFGNVHILLRDSSFQLFAVKDSIMLIYGSSRELFDRTMAGILCGFNEKLVYQNYIPQRYNMELYFLSGEDNLRHHLTYLIDTVGLMSQKQDDERDAILRRWNIPELENFWKNLPGGIVPGTKVASIVFPPIPLEIFSYGDSLFILNYMKDSILCYSPEGTFKRSAPVEFHKEERLWGIDYRDLEFITDPVANKVYLAERRIARWILHPFDTSTGTLLQEIALPDFAGMTDIKAHNDAIYFLYHDRLFPYYTRLYRYQL
jgi:hypothetical protein